MNEHIGLKLACEVDMTVYQCPICKANLRRSKSPETNWKWYYYCIDEGPNHNRRHYATRCNFSVEANDNKMEE